MLVEVGLRFVLCCGFVICCLLFTAVVDECLLVCCGFGFEMGLTLLLLIAVVSGCYFMVWLWVSCVVFDDWFCLVLVYAAFWFWFVVMVFWRLLVFGFVNSVGSNHSLRLLVCILRVIDF